MIFCPSCRNECSEDHKFCFKCGASLEALVKNNPFSEKLSEASAAEKIEDKKAEAVPVSLAKAGNVSLKKTDSSAVSNNQNNSEKSEEADKNTAENSEKKVPVLLNKSVFSDKEFNSEASEKLSKNTVLLSEGDISDEPQIKEMGSGSGGAAESFEVPHKVSVFSENAEKRESSSEDVDKAIADWDNCDQDKNRDVSPLLAAGASAVMISEKEPEEPLGPFSKYKQESEKASGSFGASASAGESGSEVPDVRRSFKTVSNVFEDKEKPKISPTSSFYTEREHACAVESLPRNNAEGNNKDIAEKVSLITCGCGITVCLALILLCFAIWFVCFAS